MSKRSGLFGRLFGRTPPQNPPEPSPISRQAKPSTRRHDFDAMADRIFDFLQKPENAAIKQRTLTRLKAIDVYAAADELRQTMNISTQHPMGHKHDFYECLSDAIARMERKGAVQVDPIDPPADEPTYDVVLDDVGMMTILVSQALREVTGLSSTDVSALMTNLPAVILRGVSPEAAEAAKARLERERAAVRVVETVLIQPPSVNPSDGSYTVILEDAGSRKINVIRVIREHTNLGLKEAKDKTDHSPSTIVQGLLKEHAEQIRAALEREGAVATLVRDSRVGLDTPTPVVLNSVSIAGDFSVVLDDAGRKKIEVIKVIREITSVGLKEAKDLSEKTPSVILHNIVFEVALEAKAALEKAGAAVRLTQDDNSLTDFVLDEPAPRLDTGHYNVVLTNTGRNKIAVIKTIREHTQLGLKEAKDLADDTPSVVLRRVSRQVADAARAEIEHAGGTVELQEA